jgi:hypothetical protein
VSALHPLTLYELCVQSPRHVCALLRGVYADWCGADAAAGGGGARVLHEDFCGSAALSRYWLSSDPTGASRALGTDLDGPTLAYAQARAHQAGLATSQHRPGAPLMRGTLSLLHADCAALGPSTTDGTGQPDVIFAGNISIGYLRTRAALLAYLRAAKARLDASNAGFGGGLFACDIYGGASAYGLGVHTRVHPGTGPEMIHYVWRHEEADPRTARVVNSMSLRVTVGGEIVADLPRAFVYEWRLWGLAELREAMAEAGFARSAVYEDINVAPGQAPQEVRSAAELPADWTVLVVAR